MITIEQFGQETNFHYAVSQSKVEGLKPYKKKNAENMEVWTWSIDESLFQMDRLRKSIRKRYGTKYDQELEYLEKKYFYLLSQRGKGNKKNVIQKESSSPFSNFTLSDFFYRLNDEVIIKSSIKNIRNLTGDVYSIQMTEESNYVTLTDDERGWNRITLKIPSEIHGYDEICEDDVLEFDASFFLVKNHAQFGMVASRIKRLKDRKSKRLMMLEKWKEATPSTWYEKEKYDFIDRGKKKTLKRIGLISNGVSGQGYGDFIHLISEKYEIIKKLSPMSAKNMAFSIKEFCEEGIAECIVIVRGGGNRYDLSEFSNPILLEAMYESTLPIITGVGHATDTLECSLLADKDTITPTDSARFLNSLLGINHLQNDKERIKTLIAEIKRLRKENMVLKEEILKHDKKFGYQGSNEPDLLASFSESNRSTKSFLKKLFE